jgi:excinuclease ABC subunit A
MQNASILARGVRVHNLRNVSLEFPKHALVCFTGPSGSGKSSMAFDTLFAEGQRRYVESLSVYARQFLGRMEKPDYDEIRGLSPTVSIEQKSISHNPRSTVGTITEVHDHLRLLYARLGVQHCHQCGKPVGGSNLDGILRALDALEVGTRFQILAPLVRNRKGEFRELFDGLRSRGFSRARVDGAWVDIADIDRLKKTVRHTVDVVIDRLISGKGAAGRLATAVESALKEGDGSLVVLFDGGERAGEEALFSTRNACLDCGISFPPLTQQSFSFNSPLGRCPKCDGLGVLRRIDEGRVVPDANLSLAQGALAPCRPGESALRERLADAIDPVVRALGLDRNVAFGELPATARQVLLYGSKTPLEVPRSKGTGTLPLRWAGLIPMLQKAIDRTDEDDDAGEINTWVATEKCADCEGTRLRPESRAVRFAERSIADVGQMTVRQASVFASSITLEGRDALIGTELVAEIAGRLSFLDEVGVAYLTLDRPGPSLSGGEAQRIRLASQLGSRLTGVLYVLDEPSIGLHQRDNHRLLDTLRRLRDMGNSVLVVEHDRDTMLAAEWLVDFGPGAGRLGGTVTFAGPPSEIAHQTGSITADYLTGRRSIEVPAQRRAGDGASIVVNEATAHNLRGISVRFPIGAFTCVTGVSGAGKSTLVNDILLPAAANTLLREAREVGAHGTVEGLERIDKVIEIDQQPIGRTPRSNPATYIKLFDEIRQSFSQLPEAKIYGYSPGRFSFNVKGGRCEDCSGAGMRRIEMGFMADAWVQCETCRGRRFNEATLRVKYRGRSIADVLAMSIEEAAALFEPLPRIRRKLETLLDVGLGYMTLGQPSTTLSGGEAQRIKLAKELSRVATGGTLYILDEPSTGLHFEDIRRLLHVVQRLVDAGNTVVMIEHNLDIIKVADHVIDLGPEGGPEGGFVVAEGTPEHVATVAGSHTGRYLRAELGLDPVVPVAAVAAPS